MDLPEHDAPRPPWQQRIQVGGFNAFSTVDWPGRLAAVVFLRGCPWRCGYCHNPELQTRTGPAPIAWDDVEAQLARRRGFIDGVVFSGGEPTADRALPDAIARVRELGFAVGLHTGGAYSERLEALLPQLDWVGFDLKTDPAEYETVTGVRGSGARAWASAKALVAAGVAHEFRLTYHGALVSPAAAQRVAQLAAHLGVEDFALQAFRAEGCGQDWLMREAALPAALVSRIEPLFPRFKLRSAS
ncbi:anaerobic ribonucleoside-triphosphate reductase activating protein [Niveibacterium sp. 24ML]|uniref:anaerobic ribonucleoside-triphosphate reductase activating protein n=1 Tax=Niveibacterium sp. 24ML TaxID=2985512 RepID=UPI00226F396B|nr:anaerobic ribonucleoside-triphosphate reductase activating protein [Niveibacterium sp. 24ML]MCX9155983.1 anaerobic ribonucleoside-triphosphate reductase activating protein [Niveibacterium sp. 24ML]